MMAWEIIGGQRPAVSGDPRLECSSEPPGFDATLSVTATRALSKPPAIELNLARDLRLELSIGVAAPICAVHVDTDFATRLSKPHELLEDSPELGVTRRERAPGSWASQARGHQAIDGHLENDDGPAKMAVARVVGVTCSARCPPYP